MKNYELRITNYEFWAAKIICGLLLLAISTLDANAQSINQSSPTPITTNEISGRIPARDLGDARLTTYYYTFDGVQGDVFVNVVTTNFNGDIDVFTADNLRPLTKITVYADTSSNETGRVIYLRQPVKMILRVEGRTPNDDAATFQIKFAGSFAPSNAVAENDTAPEIKSNNETDVRVNSVGTIIEVKPKPTPTPKITVVKVEKPPKVKKVKPVAENKPEAVEDSTVAVAAVEDKDAKDNLPKEKVAGIEPKENVIRETVAEAEPKKTETPVESQPPVAVAEKTAENETKPPPTEEKVVEETPNVEKSPVKVKNKAKEAKEKKKSNAVKPVPPSALANINLIILFKDGTKVERPMSDVLKVGVDKGILTVISKDGVIGRYSILDVEKMTIE